jgi:catechol 2,3-dioxygenase-like lactoylglutathione lyase family enzyme
MALMKVPALDGIHHLKVHVTDVRRSAGWYAETLGYQPIMEFVEGTRLVGYGLSHPNGGTLLTLRLDPDQARKTAGWVYFEMGVPDTDALTGLAERLDGMGIGHGPVVRTPIGWLLPGVFDPDGHEMRFYVSRATRRRRPRAPQADPRRGAGRLDRADGNHRPRRSHPLTPQSEDRRRFPAPERRHRLTAFTPELRHNPCLVREQ